MAGIYKIGFRDGETAVADAKEQALAVVRAGGDQDEVTAGPEVLQTDVHAAAGEFLVRIVTGIEDPLIARPRDVIPQVAPAPPGEQALARLAALSPQKLAALDALLTKITEEGGGGR